MHMCKLRFNVYKIVQFIFVACILSVPIKQFAKLYGICLRTTRKCLLSLSHVWNPPPVPLKQTHSQATAPKGQGLFHNSMVRSVLPILWIRGMCVYLRCCVCCGNSTLIHETTQRSKITRCPLTKLIRVSPVKAKVSFIKVKV